MDYIKHLRGKEWIPDPGSGAVNSVTPRAVSGCPALRSLADFLERRLRGRQQGPTQAHRALGCSQRFGQPAALGENMRQVVESGGRIRGELRRLPERGFGGRQVPPCLRRVSAPPEAARAPPPAPRHG